MDYKISGLPPSTSSIATETNARAGYSTIGTVTACTSSSAIGYEDGYYWSCAQKYVTEGSVAKPEQTKAETCKKGLENAKTTIKEIKVLVPNKVVEVTFEDGSIQKSVCHEDDTFSMERAIEICVVKQAMGGSAAYNKAIRKALKVWDTQEKLRIAKEKEEKRAAKHRARYEAYKKRCQEKRLKAEQYELARKREESIEMQKEAFVRAFKEIFAQK